MSEKVEFIRVFVKSDIIDLLPAYLRRRDEDVVLLRRYIETQDFEAIHRLGHKLSGNGGTFGLDRISETGRALEAAAATRDLSKIQEQTLKLFQYLARIEIHAQREENEAT